MAKGRPRTVIGSLLLGGASVHSRLMRSVLRVDRFVGEVLNEALTADERLALTAAIYDGAEEYESPMLHPWEESWFPRRIPANAGRLLLGGCGMGREARWFVERGWEVHGFDVLPSMVEGARSRLPGSRFEVLAYEAVARAVLDDASAVPGGFLADRYDAVLLGWGSLGHILEPGERERVVRALDRLCPSGPILASFFLVEGPAPMPGRVARAGRRTGEALARWRGLDHEAWAGHNYSYTTGFSVEFTRPQLEALAGIVGRTAIFEHTPWQFPHATFVRG